MTFTNVMKPGESQQIGKDRILVTGGSGFIGTHLVNHLISIGYEVFNLDLLPPKEVGKAQWYGGSILDKKRIMSVLGEVQPKMVIHLAAYASMDAKSLNDFIANTEGTRILLEALKTCQSIERVIVTSSQHVRRPGTPPPTSDTDYVPHEFYGESKVITENNTREAGLECCWTIIRPTTVWGPFQPPLADGVWRVLKRGLYLHPKNDPVLRSYGYVKNVVWQIERLLCAPVEKVNHRVFYVGDKNIRQFEWVNAFARALTGKNVKTVPLWIIKSLAFVGDVLRNVGVGFPMYGSRLYNLISPNSVPIEPTLILLGPPPYSMEEGIRETMVWLDEYYKSQANKSVS